MKPRTEAQRLGQGIEGGVLAAFLERLAALPDPRRGQGRRYPLETVVVIALMALVCGRDDAEGMEERGNTNADWLATFLDMPHGPPSQGVLLRVFAALYPEAFQTALRSWVALLRLRVGAQGPAHLAVDGKTVRRAGVLFLTLSRA